MTSLDTFLALLISPTFRGRMADFDRQQSMTELAAVERYRASEAARTAVERHQALGMPTRAGVEAGEALAAAGREVIPMRIRRSRNGCWLWQGAKNPDGYGQMDHRWFTFGAHRVSYLAFVGPIPEGLVIDHLCRVRHCVNPAHLEAVTSAENIRRGLMTGMSAYPHDWRNR